MAIHIHNVISLLLKTFNINTIVENILKLNEKQLHDLIIDALKKSIENNCFNVETSENLCFLDDDFDIDPHIIDEVYEEINAEDYAEVLVCSSTHQTVDYEYKGKLLSTGKAEKRKSCL